MRIYNMKINFDVYRDFILSHNIHFLILKIVITRTKVIG